MTQPVHVCIVTTAHPIDDVRVNNKFAHAFKKAGFKVSWVGPGHVFFDELNYNRDGIEFVLASPNRGRIDRLFAHRKVRRLAKQIADVDFFYAPEPDSARLALQLSKRSMAKVIFDIHEIYHGALLDRWLMGMKLVSVREHFRRRISSTCSRCDMVVGVSDAVLAPYVSPDKTSLVIRSCAPSWFAALPAADVCGESRKGFTLMHGKCDFQRGTHQVLEALSIASRGANDLSVVMFARGEPSSDPEAQKVRTCAGELGIGEAVLLRKGVPMQEMPMLLAGCDAGLIAYGKGLGTDSLPNRLFEYMAAGIPIIAPEYSIEISRIIKNERCGFLVDFENPESIAGAILMLRRDPALCQEMGKRAREAFLARHNWDTEVLPLIEWMRRSKEASHGD